METGKIVEMGRVSEQTHGGVHAGEAGGKNG
jgi:hypothetical protein